MEIFTLLILFTLLLLLFGVFIYIIDEFEITTSLLFLWSLILLLFVETVKLF